MRLKAAPRVGPQNQLAHRVLPSATRDRIEVQVQSLPRSDKKEPLSQAQAQHDLQGWETVYRDLQAVIRQDPLTARLHLPPVRRQGQDRIRRP